MHNAGLDPRWEKITQCRALLDVKWSNIVAAEAKGITTVAVELICHICMDLASKGKTGLIDSGSLLHTHHRQGHHGISSPCPSSHKMTPAAGAR